MPWDDGESFKAGFAQCRVWCSKVGRGRFVPDFYDEDRWILRTKKIGADQCRSGYGYCQPVVLLAHYS